MDFFAIYGYAMIYIAAYLFKADQLDENGASEKNLMIRTTGLTSAAIFYATGILKMAG